MPIEFRCPSCNKRLRTPDNTAGKRGKCPHCQSLVSIPKGGNASGEQSEQKSPSSPSPSGQTPSQTNSASATSHPSGSAPTQQSDLFAKPSTPAATPSSNQQAPNQQAPNQQAGFDLFAQPSSNNEQGGLRPLAPQTTPQQPAPQQPAPQQPVDLFGGSPAGQTPASQTPGAESTLPWDKSQQLFGGGPGAGGSYDSGYGSSYGGGGYGGASSGYGAAPDPLAGGYTSDPYASGAANPYASPQSAPAYGGGGYGGYAVGRGHRGALILTLGLLGMLVNISSFFLCFCCNVLSLGGDMMGLAMCIPAWTMARTDFAAMNHGQMDPSGRGLTQGGFVMSIIGIVFGVIHILLYAVMIIGFGVQSLPR